MEQIKEYKTFFDKVIDYKKFCGKNILVTKNLFFDDKINIFICNNFQPMKNVGDVRYHEGQFIDITDLFKEGLFFTEEQFNTKIMERRVNQIRFTGDVNFRWF